MSDMHVRIRTPLGTIDSSTWLRDLLRLLLGAAALYGLHRGGAL